MAVRVFRVSGLVSLEQWFTTLFVYFVIYLLYLFVYYAPFLYIFKNLMLP